MKNLLIIGTGGFSREVYWHAQNSIGYNTEFKIKGFLEANVKLVPEKYALLPMQVIDDVFNYKAMQDDVFIIAVAKPAIKQLLVNTINTKHGQFINLIHKTSFVAPNARLGNDIILGPYTVVTCDTIIEDHVMLNLYSSVGHDSIINECTSIMCYVDIAGNVRIGKNCFLGNGSSILPGGRVGNNVVVGAGAVVLKKVVANTTVVGIPARKVK